MLTMSKAAAAPRQRPFVSIITALPLRLLLLLSMHLLSVWPPCLLASSPWRSSRSSIHTQRVIAPCFVLLASVRFCCPPHGTFINLAAWENGRRRLSFPHLSVELLLLLGKPGMNVTWTRLAFTTPLKSGRSSTLLVWCVFRLRPLLATATSVLLFPVLQPLKQQWRRLWALREFFESSPPKASFWIVPSKQKDTSLSST